MSFVPKAKGPGIAPGALLLLPLNQDSLVVLVRLDCLGYGRAAGNIDG